GREAAVTSDGLVEPREGDVAPVGVAAVGGAGDLEEEGGGAVGDEGAEPPVLRLDEAEEVVAGERRHAAGRLVSTESEGEAGGAARGAEGAEGGLEGGGARGRRRDQERPRLRERAV